MNNPQILFALSSFHNFDSRLLVISDRVSILEWLRETIPTYEFRVTTNLLPMNGYTKELTYTNSHLYKTIDQNVMLQSNTNTEIVEMSNLCRSWYEGYIKINNTISHQRKHLGAMWMFSLQDVVYQEKVKEAEKILNNQTEDLKFLPSEAGYKKMSLRELADRVLVEHEIAMGFLARTEHLRVKWLDTLKASTSIAKHKEILVGFNRELYEYHLMS